MKTKKRYIFFLTFVTVICGKDTYAQLALYNKGMAVSIASGATLTISGDYTSQSAGGSDSKVDNQGTISLTGDWINNNSAAAPFNAFSTSAGTVVFNGTGTQNISGTATTTFNNVTFNNDPAIVGDVTLNTNNYVISNQLTMTRGNVNLNGNTLTLGTGTGTPGALFYTGGFFYSNTGTFSRWISATAAAMGAIASNELGHFPMGTSQGDYRPVWIGYGANITGGTVNVQHNPSYPSGPVRLSYTDAGWGGGTIIEGNSNSNWVVSTANGFATGGSNGSIRFGGMGFDPYLLTDLNASQAGSAVGTFAAATNANTVLEVNRTGLSTADFAKTWVIGTKNIGTSPLPIELLSFNARPDGNNVDITWSTASERNNDYFLVQRSTDGIVFTDIMQVEAAGNSTKIKNYAAVDYDPDNDVLYYRLKQIDFDGKFAHSNIVAVEFESKDAMIVYPNPSAIAESFNVNVFGKQGDKVIVSIRDIVGKEYYSQTTLLATDKEKITIDPEGKFSAGVYLVMAVSNGKVYKKKMVIR